MITLRQDQLDVRAQVYQAWAEGDRNVMMMMGTGTGKTVLFSSVIRDHKGPTVVLAHRSELVGQISLALAKYGVRHRVIASSATKRAIVAAHMFELKRDYTDDRSPVAAVSVDTFVRLDPKQSDNRWMQDVSLFVPDEAHHVLRDNKWGRAAAMLPNSWALMPTATPERPDGKGLGRHAHGIADRLILGTTMRDLINMGFRSDYVLKCPPNTVDVSRVGVSDTTGDYNQVRLREEVHKDKKLVGDVVEQYLKFCAGMQGATFAVDIEEAGKLAAAYRSAGVPAEVITGDTNTVVRAQIMARFRRGEIKQLVSVDILGEGVDVPAIEVVSMARPTASFIVYSQQFGRARGIKGKAYVLDHVGNFARHGLPDAPRAWSLDAREKRSRGNGPTDAIPLTACANPECLAAYERIYPSCPFCGHTPPVAVRASLEQVDGDLHDVDPSVIAALLGEKSRIDGAFVAPYGVPAVGQQAAYRHHMNRQRSQEALRHAIQLWAGYYGRGGASDRELQRRFYFKFGIDVLSAQTLNSKGADELYARVAGELAALNIVEGG